MAYFPTSSTRQRPGARVPPLENGDCMDQPTFHARYESMAEDVRAELVGGIVYMASPKTVADSLTRKLVGRWLDEYAQHTPFTQAFASATVIMGPASEPELDHGLILPPELGGQTRVAESEYLAGAPELIVETASTTESRDLHQKKDDYEKAGVREYVVVAVRSQTLFWFILRDRRFVVLAPGKDGLLRSSTFPGLWLDPDALLNGDRARLLAALREGLASRRHAASVATLADRNRKKRFISSQWEHRWPSTSTLR